VSGTSSIHPEQLNAVSGRFSEVGRDLGEVIRQAGERLDDLGDPWGDDEEGEQFASRYLSAAELGMRALTMLAISVPQIGVGLSQMGSTYSLNETDLATISRQLGASSPAGGHDLGPAAGGGGGLLASVDLPSSGAIELAMNPDRSGTSTAQREAVPAARDVH